MDLSVNLIDSWDDFLTLESDWDGCLDPSDPITVFLRHGWFVAWYEAFFNKEADRLRVLQFKHGDNLVGFAPLYLTRRSTPLGATNLVRFLVNAHSHKIDFICHPKWRAEIALAVMEYMLQSDSHPILEFEDLLFGSEACAAIRRGAARGWYLGESYIRQSPYLDLEGVSSWTEFRKGLSKKFRELTNNARNRLQRAGEVAIRCITSVEEIQRYWTEIDRISRASWQGENGSGVTSRSDTALFYNKLLLWAASAGVARLWVCELNGKAVAYEIHLVGPDVEYGLKAEFDQNYKNLSPGAALDSMIVERLIDEGVSQYDLLGYADAYKLRWTSELREHVRLFAYPRRGRARAAYIVDFPLRRVAKKLPGAAALKKKLVG